MGEQQPAESRSFVLDTSVAVKWYLPEEGHEDAIELLKRAESEEVGLLAPSTIYPEFFNALWWQHRREGLPLEELRASWEQFAADPVLLYAPEDLMHRAAAMALDSGGVIIYDALFLALAEDAQTSMITADDKLLRALKGTDYAGLARSLSEVGGMLR